MCTYRPPSIVDRHHNKKVSSFYRFLWLRRWLLNFFLLKKLLGKKLAIEDICIVFRHVQLTCDEPQRKQGYELTSYACASWLFELNDDIKILLSSFRRSHSFCCFWVNKDFKVKAERNKFRDNLLKQFIVRRPTKKHSCHRRQCDCLFTFFFLIIWLTSVTEEPT